MYIRAFKIPPETALKISEKHNIPQKEILEVLRDDDPRFKKAGGNQYIAIGYSRSRYLTLFFTYQNNEANITTAYAASKRQIKAYKRIK